MYTIILFLVEMLNLYAINVMKVKDKINVLKGDLRSKLPIKIFLRPPQLVIPFIKIKWPYIKY